jgi:phage terminase large subunit
MIDYSRTRKPRKTRAATMEADVVAELRRQLACYALANPFAKYHDDPCGFCVDVLGFEPWEGQQTVLNLLAQHDAITVPAGRAVGKSRLDGAAALWFACTRGTGARVILTAPTFKQVQQILWEEIRNLWQNARVPLPGDCAKMASTGARLSTGAQIIGITADKPEAFQGIRGAVMLLIADEASGIHDEIFHVLDGNAAGGAKLLLTGNPTRATGYFRESIRSPRFKVIQLSAEDSPNVKAGRIVVRGLATLEWLEDRRREWGEDSPLYKIHVLGQVVELEEGRLFSVEMIGAATEAYAITPPTGALTIGIDPAGDSGDGDESAFACRRGKRINKLHARRGLTPEGHVFEALGLIATQRGDSTEPVRVVVDRDGYVGAKVFAAFAAYLVANPNAFVLYGIRGGEKARRKPLIYDRVRDEVWFNLVDCVREGLAFDADLKLTRELAEVKAEAHISGRSKVTAKDELRRALGRSPDRADAVCLACVEVIDWAAARPGDMDQQAPPQHDPYRDARARGMDPYAAMDPWGRR